MTAATERRSSMAYGTRPGAGSATLSAYVLAQHRLVYLLNSFFRSFSIIAPC